MFLPYKIDTFKICRSISNGIFLKKHSQSFTKLKNENQCISEALFRKSSN